MKAHNIGSTTQPSVGADARVQGIDDAGLDAGAVDDAQYLQELGYKQELKRALGFFSSFGVQFTGIAISGGLFLTLGLGLTTAGPGMFWAWVLGGGLQMIVALSIAELLSAYPLAGGAYQIVRRITRPVLGWQVGWWLIMAHIAAFSGEAIGLAPFIARWFGIKSLDTAGTLEWGIALILLITAINLVGVKIAAIVNNIGVIAELLAMSSVIVILLFFVHHFQPLSFLRNTGGTQQHGGYLLPFLFALLVPAFIISGFDVNGSTGEETTNAARTVPQSQMTANIAAYLYGTLGIGVILLSITNLPAAMGDSFPLIYVLKSSIGVFAANVFQVLAIIALFVNMEILELTAARVLWAQARDGQMPFATRLRTLNRQQIPAITTILSAVVAILFALYSPFLNVLLAVTAVAWAAGYAVTVAVGIMAKMRGTLPAHPWHYGRWWPLIDGVALVWSLVLCFVLIYQNPQQVGLGFLGVVIAGLLIYYFAIPKSRRGIIVAPSDTPKTTPVTS